MSRLVLVACALLFLAACSKGDRIRVSAAPVVDPDPVPSNPDPAPPDPDPTPPRPDPAPPDPDPAPPDPDPTPSFIGLTPQTFDNADIRPTLNHILQRSDAMTVSDFVVKTSRRDDLAPTTCSRTACATFFSRGHTLSSRLGEVQQAAVNLPPEVRLGVSGVGEKFGVRLAQAQGRTTFAGLAADYTGYDGWLDDSTFAVGLFSVRIGNIGGVDAAGWQVATGASFGNDTGSRPTGNVTWRGIMVGRTSINGPFQTIQGDASLTYHAERNDLDVAFTNVWNLDTEARFTDMQWTDLPMKSDGSFSREKGTMDIEGRIYGPGHAEVGGVFAHPPTIGAFGAKRQ